MEPSVKNALFVQGGEIIYLAYKLINQLTKLLIQVENKSWQ